MTRRLQSFGRVLLFFLALLGGAWLSAEWGAGLPHEIHLMLGRGRGFEMRWPIVVSLPAAGREQPVLRLAQTSDRRPLLLGFAGTGPRRLVLYPVREGSTRLTLRLFGLIPLRERQVTVLPEVRVVTGGQSIGVLVASRGVVVTGFRPVTLADGGTEEPARKAGVRVGDLVTAVDGRPVYTASQLGALVGAGRGRPVVLEIWRGGRQLQVKVAPACAGEEPEAGGQSGWRPERPGRWRLGLYVEDPTAGVGTLSFWDPRTGIYGALGHMITDGFTRQRVTLHQGRIVPAVIAGIQPGRRGRPGEKIGLFHHRYGVLGTIERNTACGIFGRIVQPPAGDQRFVPVATREEVHTGPAEIRTVVRQQQVESFRIEIVRVRRSARPTGKSLVIRVTDPRLLASTGGIIQGMSGSPIIQDGRLAGVVTHVFVNDPARGYGVLAEWMALEGGLIAGPDQVKKGESRAS
ncbi:MAG: SpoIVB peptidase [Bacillota bacterium]|nr:SpoIVB peptidase [Bacillota bacterium]